ncbi:hypothetical protein CEXT_470831 [Caerostris extrusa]|uniref:Uncharacterized protein n=1 Tax=Caerostris extrusa TaxID=172846 RepID=A0AAV4WZ01_CAEEX|nr:hypothetical protein CEXT_470831 [Caerostris extrusa]
MTTSGRHRSIYKEDGHQLPPTTQNPLCHQNRSLKSPCGKKQGYHLSAPFCLVLDALGFISPGCCDYKERLTLRQIIVHPPTI